MLGKFDDKIDCFKFWGEPKHRLEAMSAAAGYSSLTDFIRELLLVKAMGADHVRTLYERRIDAVLDKSESSAGGKNGGI
jgi:hypothetical protein